jgi:hypothetical protein
LTQDGASKLIQNTMAAKSSVRKWQQVAIVLAEALDALDIRDIESDLEPYYSASIILEKIKEGNIEEVISILKLG